MDSKREFVAGKVAAPFNGLIRTISEPRFRGCDGHSRDSAAVDV